MCTWCAGPLIGGTGDKSASNHSSCVRRSDEGCGRNVRTLRNEGTQSLTVKTLHKYGVGITCLSEVCLLDSGHKIIKVPESDHVYHLYYSWVEDNSGLYGVVIALSPLAPAALLAWEPVFHTLATVRLKSAVVNISVISVYAPTLNAAGKDKDIFYRDLQAVVDRTPSIDFLEVAGDWNAFTGPVDENARHCSQLIRPQHAVWQ